MLLDLLPGTGRICFAAIKIPLKNLTVVNDDGVRYLDKEAKTVLYFGTSQPDELSCALTGKKPIAVEVSLA